MPFRTALKNISDNISQMTPEYTEGISDQMHRLLKIGGIFPVPKGYLSELTRISHLENVRPEVVSDSLYLDPLSAMRLLALGESAAFATVKSTSSLESLLSRVGVLKIADAIADLANVTDMKRVFLGRALASDAYQKMILTVLLTDRFYRLLSDEPKGEGWQYRQLPVLSLLPSFSLAYVKPNLYSACALDAEVSETATFERCFRKMIGQSQGEFAKELAQSLGLSKELVARCELMDIAPWNRKKWDGGNTAQLRAGVTAGYIALKVAQIVISGRQNQTLIGLFQEMESKVDLKRDIFLDALSGLATDYFDVLTLLGVTPYLLPEYIHAYQEEIVDEQGKVTADTRQWPSHSMLLKDFIYEIKACLNTAPSGSDFFRLPQAVLATFLGLIRALGFERATLYRYDKEAGSLIPMSIYGREVERFYDRTIVLEDESDYSPLKQALERKRATFQGDPLFEDDWPFAAFPVIWNNEVWAVFYADKKERRDAQPLTTDEQVSTMALAEEWSSVPIAFR